MVYLHAEPATLWSRIRHSRNRPLLQTADPLARLSELYAQRDALYRETADHVVESERSEVMRFARQFEAPHEDRGPESSAPAGSLRRTIVTVKAKWMPPSHLLGAQRPR